jgi:hypothetical protein
MDNGVYRQKLEELITVTVRDLKAARGDPAGLRVVLARFYQRGADADFTTGELVDYLGVSSPSILERAGFSDDEVDRAMAIVADLTDEEIAAVEE